MLSECSFNWFAKITKCNLIAITKNNIIFVISSHKRSLLIPQITLIYYSMGSTIPKDNRVHQPTRTEHPLVKRICTPDWIDMMESIYHSSSLKVIYFSSKIITSCEDSTLVYFPHLVEETIMDYVVACRLDIIRKLLIQIPYCYCPIVIAIYQSALRIWHEVVDIPFISLDENIGSKCKFLCLIGMLQVYLSIFWPCNHISTIIEL